MTKLQPLFICLFRLIIIDFRKDYIFVSVIADTCLTTSPPWYSLGEDLITSCQGRAENTRINASVSVTVVRWRIHETENENNNRKIESGNSTGNSNNFPLNSQDCELNSKQRKLNTTGAMWFKQALFRRHNNLNFFFNLEGFHLQNKSLGPTYTWLVLSFSRHKQAMWKYRPRHECNQSQHRQSLDEHRGEDEIVPLFTDQLMVQVGDIIRWHLQRFAQACKAAFVSGLCFPRHTKMRLSYLLKQHLWKGEGNYKLWTGAALSDAACAINHAVPWGDSDTEDLLCGLTLQVCVHTYNQHLNIEIHGAGMIEGKRLNQQIRLSYFSVISGPSLWWVNVVKACVLMCFLRFPGDIS